MADYPESKTEDQERFLAAYLIAGSLTRAMRACRIGHDRHYGWLQHDESYRERFNEVQRMSAYMLEEVARERAIDGLREYKFHQGVPIPHPITGDPYYESKVSDGLLKMLLEAHNPERFGRRVIHGGDVENPVQVSHDVKVEWVDDWYGVSSEAAAAAAASDERAQKLRAIQDVDLRSAMGQNGDGTNSDT